MSEPITYQQHWDRTDHFDPPSLLLDLSRERPLTRMTYPDGHVGWLVTGHELSREILSNPVFSHNYGIGHFPITKKGKQIPPLPVMPGMFIHMDPPEHTKYRKLLTGEFTTRRMNQWADRVDVLAAEHLKAMREQGTSADLVASFVRPLVLQVICELIGIPYEECEKIAQLPDTSNDESIELDDELAAGRESFFYVRDLVQRKRDEPGDDMLSRLIAAGELTDQEITNMILLVFVAGYSTTEAALTCSTLALLHHTDRLAEFRANPRSANAIEELLRYTTVNQYQIFRTALEDIELGGETIRKDDTVTVSLPAANRDPAKFGCPHALDFDRDTSGQMAFGYGVHMCLGQNLARIVIGAGLRTLVEELPGLELAVPLEEVPLRGRSTVVSMLELPVRW
ncbi:cytochrome P450 [Streptomyces tanashiensis]|uniref:cytochrome P450 n=1 Tax=Streptomyces tanashiensis TaxID=67367 RepID=UPI0034131ED4